ncbi:MAG: D-alanine--D-alanine ligase [Bacteroidetes bacterium GWC2_33_15]|nr:MAG: D-alanine--D-alanine ligase [Bacteroidetes bacterium GWA2_33_15]OFX49492.1 MAG: D-alanine--D-alanine ligase [Bacteroidetes bacterium GWC2_33_15]OFX63669.1 MAG: D-alanine--D-alanine ligase [Bacteroidetes bacterium GWB2_32_14]OFX68883.1 MAG: D-alanine--D-alanine ligase [Bacteroidetes bacterium GWD2_33_33]HAN17515.1 D-alanine--D-alanine ligase [Bacteroidales bacterium]
MKIGITYDLQSDYLKEGFSKEEAAEFDKEDTIEAIDNTLKEIGFETVRVGNVKELTRRIAKGDKWDLIFNICEGMYGVGREAQVPALLDAWNIPYVFSGPLTLALTLDKAMTKRVIRDAGIPTAEFFVVEKPEDINNVKIKYPLFAKPVAEGTGKGIYAGSVISDIFQLRERCNLLLSKFNQPVLVEKYLSGREFTVGIVGSGADAKAVGVMEIILNNKAEQGVYSFHNKDNYLELVDYHLATGDIKEQCEKVALDSWRILNCVDGGRVDVRFDDFGVCNFIEVNPLAGLHPVHSDLPILSRIQGITYLQLMSMIMNSAIERLKSEGKLKK